MALAPIHLPAAPDAAVTRLRPRLVPSRRRRHERLGRHDALSNPSDIALRSVGAMPGLYR